MKKLLIIILCLPLLFSCGGGDNGLSIGDAYQGGIIFYLDGKGGGLIAAPSDQSYGTAEWGCMGTDLSGAGGIVIGTGAQNTINIVTECNTAGTAGYLCANLTLGGYSDWFLPSKDELNQMFLNIGPGNALGLGNTGDFKDEDYFSSSELSGNNVWIMSFWNPGGIPFPFGKNSYCSVRAVRAF